MTGTTDKQRIETINRMFRSALIAFQAGQPDAASTEFNRILDIAPTHGGAINGLGMIAIQRGDRSEARQHWLRAIKAAPEFAAPYVNLGNLDRRSAPMEAVEHYKRGVSLAPDDAQAVFALATLLASLGLTADAASLSNDALRRFPRHPGLSAVAAKGMLADDRIDEGIALLAGISLERAGNRIAQLVHYTRAELYDRKNDPENALRAVDAGRQALEALFPNALEEASYERANLVSIGANYREHELPFDPEGPGADLVFLVGFPGSGSERLSNVIRHHPAIRYRDDGTATENALREAFGSPAIPRVIGPELADQCRKRYNTTFGNRAGRQVVRIDHLPINMAYAGFLAEIFPGARFVKFNRDPVPTCLSASMRSYELSPISAHLVRFESAVDLYRAVQSNWDVVSQRLAQRTWSVEYDECGADPSSALAGILDFIGLPGKPSPDAARDFGTEIGPVIGDWQRYEQYLSKTALVKLTK